MEPITITNNQTKHRYETTFPDGSHVFISYEWLQGKLALMHTFVPKAHEGKGIASSLAKHVLDEARTLNKRVLPYCPYIQTYLKRHPEYNDIIDPLPEDSDE